MGRTGDMRPDARGAAIAFTDFGHAVECPHRRAPAGRGTAPSRGPVLPSGEGIKGRSAYRRVLGDALWRSAIWRIAEGYGALIEYLVSQCRRHRVAIHLGAIVKAIDADHRRITVHCDDGAIFEAAAAILTVPLPVLNESSLPPAAREKAAASTDIGFGNVVKIPLRFATGGGLITAGETSPTCRFCVPTRPPRPGGRSTRPDMWC